MLAVAMLMAFLCHITYKTTVKSSDERLLVATIKNTRKLFRVYSIVCTLSVFYVTVITLHISVWIEKYSDVKSLNLVPRIRKSLLKL